jgi:hypothetical protein
MIGAESRPEENYQLFPASLPSIAKEGVMKKPVEEPGGRLRLATAGRRRSPMTMIFLILGEILLITCLTGALASADSQTTQIEKGNNSMQHAATVAVKDVPPLDRSVPSHVETFTFGLG